MTNKTKEIQAELDRVDFGITAEHNRIKATRERIKEAQEERDEIALELTFERRRIEHAKTVALGQKWRDENPIEHAAFLEKIRLQNQENVIEGFLNGWWDLDDDGNMAAPPLTFSIADFKDVKNPLMAHVMKEAGIFPSIGQARKNGWDKPLTIGEWSVTKKKIRIKVTK